MATKKESTFARNGASNDHNEKTSDNGNTQSKNKTTVQITHIRGSDNPKYKADVEIESREGFDNNMEVTKFGEEKRKKVFSHNAYVHLFLSIRYDPENRDK